MNRLGFKDFHSKHFGPEQTAYWQNILRQQQQQQYFNEQQYDLADSATYSTDQQYAKQYSNYYQGNEHYGNEHYGNEHYGNENYENQQYENERSRNEQYENQTSGNERYEETYHEDAYYEEEYYEEELSKEAIEIFRFSEAYRKEREAEKLKEETEDQEGMQDWQYDESTVHISGGMEAPATSLVLTNKTTEYNDKIKIQQDLLNTAYLASCTSDDAPIILWPVLPFKM